MMLPNKPEDWPHVFEQHLNAGNLDAIMVLYEPEARFVARSGETMEGPVQPTPSRRRRSQLDPFYEYLTERWNEGCSNAHQLFVELRENMIHSSVRWCSVC
jgi:hypothetical protein